MCELQITTRWRAQEMKTLFWLNVLFAGLNIACAVLFWNPLSVFNLVVAGINIIAAAITNPYSLEEARY